MTYIGFNIEFELASDAGWSVAVGTAPLLFADSIGFGSRAAWLGVCPLVGMDKHKVAEAESVAAKKGDKRMSLSFGTFGTSTHQVGSELAKDALRVSLRYRLFICCPLCLVCEEF